MSKRTIASEADSEVSQLVLAEQLRAVFAHGGFAVGFTTVFACALAWYLHGIGGGQMVQVWITLKIAISAIRVGIHNIYRLQGSPQTHDWQLIARSMLFVDGLVWGMAGWWMTPIDNDLVTGTICASLVAASAIATFGLHADWVANAAYCGSVLLPGVMHLISRLDGFGMFSGVALMGYMGLLLAVARRAQLHIIELIWLRLTTDRIAAERAQALDLARHQSAVKSQFLATMSHEMRTPLHGILGLTKITTPATLSKNLGLIQRSGMHLLDLINDVLDYSRIEAGHLQIDNKVVDLVGVVDDVVGITSTTAQAKGLRLDVRLELPRPCWVQCDPQRLRQVLLNLLGNAVKFTDQGAVRLTVSASAFESGQTLRTFKFEVEDSGIGIAPESLPRIFEAFHQVDNSFGRRHGGTGLGLTISREISRAMGGDLTCRSELGKGSVFTFTAPLTSMNVLVQAPAGAVASARPAVAAGPSEATLPDFRRGDHPPYVLLAEDNEVNAMVTEALLRRFGLVVEVVSDGASVIEKTRAPIRPDLILMDCQMPGMDGFEATRQIRQHEKDHDLPRLPVIALTANALSGDRERCLEAGMDDHLSKPFDDARLAGMLSAYLGAPAAELRGVTPVPQPAALMH
jgi:signal transduction histidine kinase